MTNCHVYLLYSTVSKATVAAPNVSVFESSLKPTAEQLDSWNVRLSPGETMVACGSVMMKSSGPFGRAQPRQLIITTGGSCERRIMKSNCLYMLAKRILIATEYSFLKYRC